MKKQDLVKLALLGMMSVGATLGAQQTSSPNNQDKTNYDGSKGICTDKTSAYSSSDTSANAGKPVPQGKPAQSQSQQASSKAWRSQEASCGQRSNLATCSNLTACNGGGGNCNHSGLAGCGGSCNSGDSGDACSSEADGTCAGYSGNVKQNSAKMSNKRNLR